MYFFIVTFGNLYVHVAFCDVFLSPSGQQIYQPTILVHYRHSIILDKPQAFHMASDYRAADTA